METAGNCIFSHDALCVRADGGVKTICLVQQVPTNQPKSAVESHLIVQPAYMAQHRSTRAFQQSQLF